MMAGSAWTNQPQIAAVVIISASGAANGLFVYSGPPAAGNLIASITPSGGLDSFGNHTIAGITSYNDGAGLAVGIQSDAFQVSSGHLATGWNPQGNISGDSLGDLILSPAGVGVTLTSAQVSITAGGLLVTGGGIRTSSGLTVSAGGASVTGGLAVDTVTATGLIQALRLLAVAAAAGNQAIGVQVTGDTNPRFQVLGSGSLNWGPGNAANDTSLARSGPSQLSLGAGDSLIIPSGLTVQAGGASITGGLTADTAALSSAQAAGAVLKVTDTTAAPTAAIAQIIAAAAADRTLSVLVSGDTIARLLVDSNGQLAWGPGGATARDVSLARNAGHLDVAAADGNTYSAERLTAVSTGQTITSVNPSFTAITNLTGKVASGVTYRYRFWVSFKGSAAAGVPSWEITGPAATAAHASWIAINNSSTAAATTQGGATIGTGFTSGQTFQTTDNVLIIEGILTPSASGTLGLSGSTSLSGDNLIINGATLDLFPASV